MSTTQAKIAQRKLTEESGIPDSLADQMFHLQSGHWVAIVDLAHLDRTEGREEKHVVRLEIGQLEIMTGDSADHCRELMRAAYLSRQPKGIPGTEGEPVDRIVERGKNTILTGDDDEPWPGDPDYTPPTSDDLAPTSGIADPFVNA